MVLIMIMTMADDSLCQKTVLVLYHLLVESNWAANHKSQPKIVK